MCQSQALAGSFADFLGSKKRLEDSGANVVRYSAAGILNADLYPVSLLPGAESDEPFPGRAISYNFPDGMSGIDQKVDA